VEITPSVSKPWTQSESKAVIGTLSEDLLARLQRFRHWDFAPDNALLHRAYVRLAVRDGGPGQLVVRLELGRRALAGSPPLKLAEKVWLEPGDLALGLPSPQDVTNAIPGILNEFLPLAIPASGIQGVDERVLWQRIPIAEIPRWPDRPHGLLIFPLAKARYAHLADASFTVEFLHPQRRTRLQLVARSHGIWQAYDGDLQQALSAGVTETPADPELGQYELTLIYLKEYNPPGWDTGDLQ
jgi:hypothetical protein